MSEVVVRCPYCVQGKEFRPMLRQLGKKRFVCVGCGHTAVPGPIHSTCHCPRCRKMSRAANLCRESQELRQSFSADQPVALRQAE